MERRSSNNLKFDYRCVIEKLNFLEKRSRPNITYIVHQCACFYIKPKEEPVKAIICLSKYLHSTNDQEMKLKSNRVKSFKVWADADFLANRTKQQSLMMQAQPFSDQDRCTLTETAKSLGFLSSRHKFP